ncbi:hypothetical protein [Parvularcula lutaonensis]|nr:hypothetical protein [Parvularcula lutaonensis]
MKLITALAVTATMTMGSASLGEGVVNPFGGAVDAVPMTDAMLDAARAFEKVDVNRDGIIDEDEYAARRVVYAQLARFNRQIPIDGQSLIRIPVPEDIPNSMGAAERAALDAVARRDYHLRVMAKDGLDQSAWQDARLETFSLADGNGDGELRDGELTVYAKFLSGELAPGVPAT